MSSSITSLRQINMYDFRLENCYACNTDETLLQYLLGILKHLLSYTLYNIEE